MRSNKTYITFFVFLFPDHNVRTLSMRRKTPLDLFLERDTVHASLDSDDVESSSFDEYVESSSFDSAIS